MLLLIFRNHKKMSKQLNKDVSTFETVSSKVNKTTPGNHQYTDDLLSPSKAFQPGAQLWLITDDQHSSWTSIIDWYINFQITKYRQKKNVKTQSALNFQESIFKQKQKNSSPLLIGSSSFLTCQQLLELPYTKNWLDQAYSIWQSLNCPSLRVFLPLPIDMSKAQGYWSKSPVQFVSEPDTNH